MNAQATMLGPLHRRIMLVVGRGTLAMTNDGDGQQRVQVELLAGETRDASDRVQQYGLSGHAPPGSQVVVVNVGGERDHPVIIAADDPGARPTGLAAGEVMVWSNAGQRVHLREDGSVLLTTAAGARVEVAADTTITLESATKVRMETPLLEVTGEIRDRADGGGRSMSQMRAAYDSHGHPDASAPPGPLMGGP